jgi:hypothetical protein
MAKQNEEGAGQKRLKFDEAKFFKYLKKNADPTLVNFLYSIDKRACVELATYLLPYLRRSEEEKVILARRQRGAEIQRALSATIRALQKASSAHKVLAAIELPGTGALGGAGSKISPGGAPFFVEVLKAEEEKLSALLGELKKLYNEKRFGVSGNHLWLVMMQEFVSEWTKRELGEAKELRSEDIATLIEAAKVTLGWREDKSETDPELIRKAISTFRKNQANATFVSRQIIPYVQARCSVVAQGPYLLGIEI